MQKALLRAEYKSRRQMLSAEQRSTWDERLCQAVVELIHNTRPVHFLHAYWPLDSRNEPDTRLLFRMIWEEFPHTQLVAPRVVPGTKQMQHYGITPHTEWSANRWGILEPRPLAELAVYPEQLDMVIVPLLAFDKSGYRVGYGGGFYDRFLADCRPDTHKVGLSFWPPVEVIADRDAHDIRLDYVITPEHLWQWP